MTNPWTKKNPLMSMMLSGANAWAGAARGLWSAEARRRQSAAMKEGARQAAALWTAVPTGAATPRKRPKKHR